MVRLTWLLLGPFASAPLASSMLLQAIDRMLRDEAVNATDCMPLASQRAKTGPWRPAPQAPGSKSLCAEGRLLPELYVLGAKKSATTSLAHDLVGAGVRCMRARYNDKEFHFFDGRMNLTAQTQIDLKAQRRAWMEQLPACPAEYGGSQRRLLADFTPNNLPLVPLPGKVALFAKPSTGDLPTVLRSFYGEDAARRLSLVVLIREPLARMQSGWYHQAAMMRKHKRNQTIVCSTFNCALRIVINQARKTPPVYSLSLWSSMYAAQLKTWLSAFSPKQLYVIPFQEYTHGNKDTICRDLSRRMNFAITCDSQGASVMHAWHHPHPPPEEDVDPQLRKDFSVLMHHEEKELVEVLTRAHQQGAGLANYDGETSSQEQVRAWLHAGW